MPWWRRQSVSMRSVAGRHWLTACVAVEAELRSLRAGGRCQAESAADSREMIEVRPAGGIVADVRLLNFWPSLGRRRLTNRCDRPMAAGGAGA